MHDRRVETTTLRVGAGVGAPVLSLYVVKVERVDPADPALEASWRRLQAQSPAAGSFFMSWEWASTWLEHYADRLEVVLLGVREGDELVGLALAVERGAHGIRRMVALGQRPTRGEYLDVLARGCDAGRVTDALAQALVGPFRRLWDVALFERVLADDAILPRLTAAFHRCGARAALEEFAPSPYTDLPATVEEMTPRWSKNFRKQLNQSRNRTRRLGEDVRLRVAGDDFDFDRAFEEMLRLHALRWGAEQNSFTDPVRLQFHRDLARRLHRENHLFLAVLEVDGTAVAARYDYVYGDKIWCMQGGWDPEFEAARPGMYLTHLALEWGIDRGLNEYDFLGGDHGYKSRWATGERRLVTSIAANPRSIRGQLWGRRRLPAVPPSSG